MARKTRFTNWKGDYIPVGASRNFNTYKATDDFAGIFMQSDGVDTNHRAWGTMALTTPVENGIISYRTSSSINDWSRSILDFWDDFSGDGMLTEKEASFDDDPMASLAVMKTLGPGEKKIFTFFLTWHFPNRTAWSSWTRIPEIITGNYYTTQYRDAWDVISKEFKRLPQLTEKTITFVNSFVKDGCVRYKNIIANKLDFISKFLGQFFPSLPVRFIKTVFN